MSGSPANSSGELCHPVVQNKLVGSYIYLLYTKLSFTFTSSINNTTQFFQLSFSTLFSEYDQLQLENLCICQIKEPGQLHKSRYTQAAENNNNNSLRFNTTWMLVLYIIQMMNSGCLIHRATHATKQAFNQIRVLN